MKRLIFVVLLVILSTSLVMGAEEITTIWEKSESQGTLPSWFDTGSLTRGFAFGAVDGNERLFVVSRNGGSFIYVLDAATGDSVGVLDATGITGGTYHVSDVGVSDDGVIFVCNLALGGNFKVYKYANEGSAPEEAIVYDATGKRLGDKITVTGSVADNSVTVWAASASSTELVKFTTTDNAVTFTPEVMDLGLQGGSASVGPMMGGFYYNATGSHVHKFDMTGADLGSISGGVVSTGSNSVRYITTLNTTEYIVTFQYGAGNENARIIKLPDGDPAMAASYVLTPSLGGNGNGNGTGDVAVKDNGDDTFTVFVLGTNNGIGAYQVQFPVPPVDPMNLTLNWEMGTGMYPFFANDNNTRGLGYNPATNHVLVPSRSGGVFIYALDAETGLVADTLDMTNVTGGVLPLMKAVADENGVIYACNLALAGGEFKVYRWADETAVPTVAFAAAVIGRTGDAFAITGSGLNTVIYGSGSGSAEIVVLTTTDGETFTAETPVPVATGAARGGIAPTMPGLNSEIWVNGSGTTLQHIGADGTLISEIPGSVVASSWMNVAYIESDKGAKLLAVSANNVTGDARKLQVWDVTADETNPLMWGIGETSNLELKNANGSGELVAVDNNDGTYNIYQMTTNNAIASWTLQLPDVMPVMTIAEAKVDANNDNRPDLLDQEVTIRGVITSPNYGYHSQYYMQDAEAGIVLYSGNVDLDLNIGDEILLTGTIDQYRGLTEIVPDAVEDVTVLSTGKVVEPKKITIPEMGEAYEAMLVQLDNVKIVDIAQWPAEGKNGSVDITDDTDTTYIYIDKESDLDGWDPPTGYMQLSAVIDQYSSSSSVYDDGYSLRGTIKDHFVDLTPVGPQLPIVEAATDGTFDQEWAFNSSVEDSYVEIVDSTASAWGSHAIRFVDTTYTGLAYVKDALFENYTIEADIYIVGEADPDFSLYTGIGIKMASDETKYYRFVFRNSSSSDHGQLRLQGYDGASWHISQYWNPGEDFDALETGWHNFKVTVMGNTFYAYIDGELLPGCPYSDEDPFLTEGYPGVYKYNAGIGDVIFDNFMVTEPIVPPPPAPEKLFTLWAQTQAAGTYPDYMSSSNYERGMAYGNVNGQDRVYVVTRFGPHRLVIHDAMTGDVLGEIPKPPQAEGVGLFHLNCVDVSDDGVIFACNMSLGSDATHPFRVYRWDSEDAEALTAISYDAGLGRMGDMFSVYGRADDNSLTIYAGVKDQPRIVKFTTMDNGMTFTPEVIELETGPLGTVANIAEANDKTLYVKAYASPLVHINADGTVIDTISTGVVGTGASKIVYQHFNDKDYILAYYPDIPGAGDAEKMDMVNVTNGSAYSVVEYFSPSLGSVSNGNGTGSVDLKVVDDETILFFLMGTNNGVAAFTNNDEYFFANVDTLFYGNTPSLLENPYGTGYICGTNEYGDVGKYQRFDFNMNDELYGFRYFFGYKNIVGETDSINLVLKTVAEGGAPDSLIMTMKVAVQDMDTTLIGNVFFLDNPMKLHGPLFLGFEWDGTVVDDEFALFSDADGEGDEANRVWEQFNDGSFNDFSSVLNPDFSWLIDTDLWIAAYYKKATPTAVEETNPIAVADRFLLSHNYPNPFNPVTKFNVSIPRMSDVEISIYNMLGQKVKTIYNGKLNSGIHTFTFDARDFASGVYLYRVKTDGFTDVKRMILLK